MDEQIIQDYLNKELKFVFNYLITMGVTKEDAEDIIQETAFKFVTYMDGIDLKKAKSWLFRVAINHFYDLKRKNKNVVHVYDHLETISDQILTDEVVLKREKNNEVHKALANMKPLYRHLLIMKYGMDLSYHEIAARLDLNTGTLKTYLYRARQQLIIEYGRIENGR
ncbi:RNA polymerase sigma factor [Fictibacillus iocasae]|uniref:RNA polymerase sigma factor n=1 Tax=Fictibacillus iocasae TaxID=2715437 RepID=A0ABW2NS32_9BACL